MVPSRARINCAAALSVLRPAAEPLEPHHEALGVEREIVLEDRLDLGIAQRRAVPVHEIEPEGAHLGANPGGRVGVVRVRLRDARELAHLDLEELAERRDAGHAAEVHEVHRLRAVGQHPVDRGDVLIGMELRGGRRRGDESAALGIERAVRDAEGVAAEDAPVRLIHDGVVVQGVSGHVNELERPLAEPHALAVLDRPHALGGDRHERAVELVQALAVDRAGAGHELRRVDHVRCAARMQQRPRVGELLHQAPRAAGVIEMHVRQQQVVDGFPRNAELREPGEQIRDGRVGPHIDEGRASRVDDDVRGGVPRIQVLAVDGADAVRMSIESHFQGNVDRRERFAGIHIVPCRLALGRMTHPGSFPAARLVCAVAGFAVLAGPASLAARAAAAADAAAAAAPPLLAPPQHRERGSLVFENIPVPNAALAARAARYEQSREASFLDWLADGSMLIGTRFADTDQLHRVAIPLGMREQLTFYEDPVEWARAPLRGGGFAFLKDQGGDENAAVYYQPPTGAARPLTQGSFIHGSPVWAHDGRRVAFYGNDRDSLSYDVYVADVTSGAAPTLLVGGREDTWYPLDWSPDDTKLLVWKYVSITESYLYLVDAATGALTPLDDPAHPRKAGIRMAKFAPDGRGVYVVTDEDGEFGQLKLKDLVTHSSRNVTPDTLWDVEDFDVSDDGRYIAYVVNDDGRSRLTVLDTLGTLVTPQLVHYPTWDRVGRHGRMLSAYVYRPRTAGPHPVVILIHGGPESQYRPGWDPFLQFMVNELGYAVVAPNVRGSSGYGKSFLALDNGPLREDAVRDVGSLLVWIGLQPQLDRDRVVAMGASYGGYMALATLITYGERLRGGIDFMGISNFVSFLRDTSGYRRDLRRTEYGDERDNGTRVFLDRISPLTNAGRIRKPLLVAAGANDPRVPVSESEQLVWRVRAAGGEVWYLLAKDEGPGFRKKANRDAYLETVATFLQRLR